MVIVMISYYMIKNELQRRLCVCVYVGGSGSVLLPGANDVIMLKTNATAKPV